MKIIYEDVKLDTPVYRFEIDGKGIWTFMTKEVSNAIAKNLTGELSDEEYKKYIKFEELVIKLMYNKFFKMAIYYDKFGKAAFTENAFNQLNQIKVNTGHGRMFLIDAIEDILYQINPKHKLKIKKIYPKNIVFSDDVQVLYESRLRESIKRLNNMKIIKEDIENLETTETTVVPQPMGAAKEESKTLWDRFMEATKEPEDAPLFGAENQPVPDEVEEPKLTLDESLFSEDVVALQERAIGIKNFSSDIGKIVYALEWYASNISTNLDNDKYADHFDSPEKLKKAADVSIKALGRLNALMSQKMGYNVSGGGDFLDTSITKKPANLSARIADLRNLLAEHASSLIVSSPDPRVKNNDRLKNEVGELVKGLRSSLGSLAAEVSRIRQGETKGLFNKKFKESLNESFVTEWWGQVDENPYEFADNYNLECKRIKDNLDSTLYKFSGTKEDIEKAMGDGYFYSVQIGEDEGHSEDLDESLTECDNESLNEDDDFEGFDIDTPDDNPEITDEMLQEVIDDVKDTVEEAEFTPEEVIEKVFDCIEDEEVKYELAADVVKSTEEEMAEEELTEDLVYGESTLDDYLDVIKKYYKNHTASEVIDSLFLNNPCMDEQTAFDVASTLGEMIEAMGAEELDW